MFSAQFIDPRSTCNSGYTLPAVCWASTYLHFSGAKFAQTTNLVLEGSFRTYSLRVLEKDRRDGGVERILPSTQQLHPMPAFVLIQHCAFAVLLLA